MKDFDCVKTVMDCCVSIIIVRVSIDTIFLFDYLKYLKLNSLGLICPKHVVVQRHDGIFPKVWLSYPSTLGIIWSSNNVESRSFHPRPGKRINLNEPITVTVTEDGLTCNFTYLPLSKNALCGAVNCLVTVTVLSL